MHAHIWSLADQQSREWVNCKYSFIPPISYFSGAASLWCVQWLAPYKLSQFCRYRPFGLCLCTDELKWAFLELNDEHLGSQQGTRWAPKNQLCMGWKKTHRTMHYKLVNLRETHSFSPIGSGATSIFFLDPGPSLLRHHYLPVIGENQVICNTKLTGSFHQMLGVNNEKTGSQLSRRSFLTLSIRWYVRFERD